MNPSYSLYPSLQVPQIGLYPVQPSLPAVPPASTPSQVIFNIGHPIQLSSLPPPTAYAPQTAAYAPQPDTFPPKPPAYAPQPTAYQPQPSYAAQPSYSTPQPAPLYPQPSQMSYPVPLPSYPHGPEKSYPPTTAVTFTLSGSTYPMLPSHSQPNSGSPHVTSTPYPVSNPKQDDPEADKLSSINPSYKSHSQDFHAAKPSPTVRPVTPFNPQADAQVLRKAMKSGLISVDKKSIINVLAARSNKQRLEIAFRYRNKYDKNLIAALKSEFTIAGCFLDLMKALLTPLPEFLASEVRQAIVGWDSDERTLVEILCTASTVEIDAIKAEYKKLYYRPLEKDLIGENCGNFERLLASMMQVRRPENNTVDETAAIQDAQSLVTTGLLRMSLVEPSFISILCNRSYTHLRHVFKVYEQISGRSLDYTVGSQFAGVMRTGLSAIIQSIEDKAGFFADRVYDATSTVYSKDRQLIRVIVSRCEIDLQTITETYKKRYGKRMELDISRATDGHYRKTLLALIGGYY